MKSEKGCVEGQGGCRSRLRARKLPTQLSHEAWLLGKQRFERKKETPENRKKQPSEKTVFRILLSVVLAIRIAFSSVLLVKISKRAKFRAIIGTRQRTHRKPEAKMSDKQKNAMNSVDWLAVGLGAYERLREKMQEKAFARAKKRRDKAALKKVKTAETALSGMVVFGGSMPAARKNSFRAVVAERAKRIVALHGRHAATAIVSMGLAWVVGFALILAAVAFFNADRKWVSVEFDNPKTVFTQAEADKIQGSGLVQVGRKRFALSENEDFADAIGTRAGDCFSAGACQALEINWREWLVWEATGRPPAALARLGWIPQSQGSVIWQANQVGVIFGALALFFISIAAGVWIAAAHQQRGEDARRRAARVLRAFSASLTILMCALALGLVICFISCDGNDPQNYGAHPNAAEMRDVIEGRLSPQNADWKQNTLDAGSFSSEGRAWAAKCVDRGLCAPSLKDEKKEGMALTPDVLSNRALARRLAKEEDRRHAWSACWPAGFLGLGVWGAAFFFVFGVKNAEIPEIAKMERHLDVLAARGRPRLERAKLMAEMSENRPQTAAHEPAAKRRPKSL